VRLIVGCPAKINLFLSVGPLEPTGYHPIRTVYQAIGLFDRLHVSDEAGSAALHCDWPGLPPENTLTKTLRLVAELAEVPPLSLRLEKRIPPGAGLGGGSSNAAGLLRALLRLMEGRFSERDARDVASAVGVDVSFFLVGGTASGEGYGEIVKLLPDRGRRWLVVAMPDETCSTAEAYARLDGLPRALREPSDDDEELQNDFEAVAPESSRKLIVRLKQIGSYAAGLCGSGSAAFGFFRNAVSAYAAAETLRAEGYPFVEPCQTLTRAESMALASDPNGID